MATNSNIFGLLSTAGKGKATLQQIGTQPVDGENIDQNGLPSSPFATLNPAAQMGGSSPQQVAQIQQANIPQNFQFTGEWDAANRALQQQESDAGLVRTNTLAGIASQFLNANQAAEKDFNKNRTRLYEALADRGALGSSASLDRVGELETDFQSYLDRLAQQRAYDMSAAENQYASLVNNIGRQREGLVSRQQQAEEQRRLEEARLQAEAERAAREEQQRQEQIQQLIQAQEQARIAAEEARQQALAAQTMYSSISLPTFSGGGGYSGGIGGGGGGGGSAAPAPAPSPDIVRLPVFGNGVTTKAVDNWIRTNVDPNITGTTLAKVREVLSKAGPNGVSRSDLAWLIQNTSNAARVGSTAANIAKGLFSRG